MRTAIITGITGQDGAYLADFLLKKGYHVIGLTRGDYSTKLRNLQYLNIVNHIDIKECDLLDISHIINIIKNTHPDEIYNLAAQSSVRLSFDQPIGTIQYNINSVVNILEAIRLIKPDTRFYQASSSEMYGKVDKLPITINSVMHPLSPYAISKASGHWIVVNYRESYKLYACNGILFNHESYLRNQNFFIKKVIRETIQNRNNPLWTLKLGNINVRRDFGYTPKYVEAMWLMLNQTLPQDFIICSGRSYLLKDLVFYIFKELEVSTNKIQISEEFFRPTDILDIYGDNSEAKQKLGWEYDLDFYKVITQLIKEELKGNGM